jgi:8-oxo-dGTP diphosphatase
MVILLRIFGKLPRRFRRLLVRLGSPKYTVGSICIIQRDDGAFLFVRHTYWKLWGTAGGLAKRRERPELAAVRETMEEVNLSIELVGEPAVVVDPDVHRVDVVFLARPAPGADLEEVRPSSPEIEAFAWFHSHELPRLQSETISALRALERLGAVDLAGVELPGGLRR